MKPAWANLSGSFCILDSQLFHEGGEVRYGVIVQTGHIYALRAIDAHKKINAYTI